jgi:hypothetical protein
MLTSVIHDPGLQIPNFRFKMSKSEKMGSGKLGLGKNKFCMDSRNQPVIVHGSHKVVQEWELKG